MNLEKEMMRRIARAAKSEAPEWAEVIVLVFLPHAPKLANYISTIKDRKKSIEVIEDILKKLKSPIEPPAFILPKSKLPEA